MKTRKPLLEYLETLPEPYRSQAITNTNNHYPSGVVRVFVNDLSEALLSAFPWSESPEGRNYWSDLDRSIFYGDIKPINMNEYSKTVYKTDTKGKLRFLTVSSDNGYLVQESGIVGGKSTPKRSLCKAKNVGRANETTPEEQARLEAKSKIETKMSTGYFESIEEAKATEVILPMLAKSYDKEKKKVVFPCFVQRKLDGMRVLVVKKKGQVTLMSRKGKEIETLQHINKAFEDPRIPDNTYDGEAYSLGLGSFQEQMKAIKKYTKGVTEKININIYDVVLDKPYFERLKVLKGVFG